MPIPTYDEYVASLGQLRATADPTVITEFGEEIKAAAESLAGLDEITEASLVAWVSQHPRWVPALALTVGLSQESFKNQLKNRLDSTGWIKIARQRPLDLITFLDEDHDLVRLLNQQRTASYDFGDVLVARAGGRAVAAGGIASGRRVEDEIEAVARELQLPCAVRTRFKGRGNRTAPCDLVVPSAANAQIVVAAKGFDSTGSKLSDAVREIEEMAEVRLPNQYAMAVIDGIGWKSRGADLRRIYDLWAANSIDGMYTLASLDRFRSDLAAAGRRIGLIP